MKKFLIVLGIFFLDRITKMYFINLQENGTNVDFYISPFLNFILTWNTGIGFGLVSLEANIFYHLLSGIIFLIIIFLIYYLYKTRGIHAYLTAIILGGALGNLFDRLYYYAVPDFIDFHIRNFHWFVFNVADIFISTGIIGLIILEFAKKENISKNA